MSVLVQVPDVEMGVSIAAEQLLALLLQHLPGSDWAARAGPSASSLPGLPIHERRLVTWASLMIAAVLHGDPERRRLQLFEPAGIEEIGLRSLDHLVELTLVPGFPIGDVDVNVLHLHQSKRRCGL